MPALKARNRARRNTSMLRPSLTTVKRRAGDRPVSRRPKRSSDQGAAEYYRPWWRVSNQPGQTVFGSHIGVERARTPTETGMPGGRAPGSGRPVRSGRDSGRGRSRQIGLLSTSSKPTAAEIQHRAATSNEGVTPTTATATR